LNGRNPILLNSPLAFQIEVVALLKDYSNRKGAKGAKECVQKYMAFPLKSSFFVRLCALCAFGVRKYS
jgi:hypothetical protein